VSSYSTDFLGPFSFIFALVAALVVIAAWVSLAASRFVQGGVVERPERVPQLYGYTVCLVALFWGIISVLGIVEDALTLQAPELRTSAFGWDQPSVSSFEAFRVTYDRARRFGTGDPEKAVTDTVPEPELRRRYEAIRADRIQQGRFEARKDIIVNGLSLIIAAGLLVIHWRWLRRRVQPAAAP
jgi:hypothetical protein